MLHAIVFMIVISRAAFAVDDSESATSAPFAGPSRPPIKPLTTATISTTVNEDVKPSARNASAEKQAPIATSSRLETLSERYPPAPESAAEIAYNVHVCA
eukprot:SAG11_NODE_9952_length_866_cov_2.123859_1_plen_100_part_00